MFRRQKRPKISSDMHIEHLSARGNIQQRNEYVLDNTKLHDAILENNHEKFTRLLEEKESKNINETSLMNTPLLLALKLGNTDIAKCILITAKNLELKLDINHKDARGLTALDWACMLRHDELISMMLSFPYFILPENNYAKVLYSQSVDERIFERFLQNIAPEDIAENEGYPHIVIPFHEPYSDMIYFMKDICVNQGIMRAINFPPLSGVSHIWFYRCFNLGYETFCAHRNQIPVNPELFSAMLNQASFTEWKKHRDISLDSAEPRFRKFSNN